MKLSTIVFCSFFSICSFPGGGVDVGNGSRMVLYYLGDFSSQKEMIHEVHKLKLNIKKEQDVRVSNANARANCDNEISVGPIEEMIKYNVFGKDIDMQRKYKAKVGVVFKDCKNYLELPDEIGVHY